MHASNAQASPGDRKMGDLQSLMAKYEAPVRMAARVPVPVEEFKAAAAARAAGSPGVAVAARVSARLPHKVAFSPEVASIRADAAVQLPARGAVATAHRAAGTEPGKVRTAGPETAVGAAGGNPEAARHRAGSGAVAAAKVSAAVATPTGLSVDVATPLASATVKAAAPVADGLASATLAAEPVGDRRRRHAVKAEDDSGSAADDTETASGAPLATASIDAAADTPETWLSFAPASVSATVSGTLARSAWVSPMGAPQVPAPGPVPTGLIIGNNGVVGTATQLLGPTSNSLFNNTDGYVSNGGLRVSSANFTQGYSTLSALGLPLLNLTPVGTVLTTADGTVVGGTGINSHLTLVGGVTSNSYISNINNGAPGGVLGLVLPSTAPAWAAECLNVLNVLVDHCWGVNAAQDYQVLVGDGASANGSKEVVIGTGANHTLPAMDADAAFPGDGRNDPDNPTGVPTADYASRLGHSVVIGDDASGTANAQTILGAEATASVANSVALGYRSAADRGAQAGYAAYGLAAPQNSAGEVSVGADGQERQITHVAAGSAATDAANVQQLQAVAALADAAVRYDTDSAGNPLNEVTLIGDGTGAPVGIANLADGSVAAGSLDAVNGGQLFATNTAVADYFGGTTAFDPATGTWTAPVFPITSVAADGSTSTGDYDNATDAFAAVDGSLVNINNRVDAVDGLAVKYDADGAGNPTNTVTLTGDGSGAPVAVTNLAEGSVAAGSLDAVNGGQLFATNMAVADYFGGTTAFDPATGTWTAPVFPITSVAADGSTSTGDYDNATDAFAAMDGSMVNINNRVDAVDGLAVKYDADGAGNATNTITLTGDGSGAPVAITNLADGSVAAGSLDAVNGGQLFATNTAVADYFGGTTAFDPATGAWTGPVFPITSVAADGSTTTGDYDNVTDAFAAVDGSVVNVNNRIDTIDNGGGIKYFHSHSTLGDSTASGDDSIAVGPLAVASAADSVAMGRGATASMDNSIALGAGSSTATGALSGYAAYALTAPQTSLGEVNIGNRQLTGVAAGAAADDAVNVAQLQAVDSRVGSVDKLAVKYDADGAGNATNTVTLAGDGSGIPVVITNLADGSVAAGSLDAVNGGQLFATNTAVADYFGGSTRFDSTTATWIGPVFPITSVAVDGSTSTGDYTNVTDAFAAVDESVVNVNSRIDTIDNGGGIKYFHGNSTLGDSTASGDDSIAVGPLAVASAADSVAMGHGAVASMDNSIALGAGSVTAVGALTDYAAYALAAPQTSAGELNVGNRQITGVAAGAADDDAVNVAQLQAVDGRVDSVDKLAVKYDDDGAGNATNTITLAGDGSGAPVVIANLAAGAETAASTEAVNGSQLWHWSQDASNVYSNVSLYNDIQNLGAGAGSVKYFNVNSTQADSSATGADSVAIGPVAEAGGDASVAIGNGASASADNAVALGAGSVADRADSVSVGSAGHERQITNVAAGTKATDAVNMAQMQSAVTASQEGAVRYDSNADGSVDYRNVSLGNGSGDTVIHNVAAGTADTDAVNVDQFKSGMRQAVDWANAYTDQRFSALDNRIEKMGNRANAGVASAMAMAGLPQAYEPGKSMAAVAGSSFRGESSLAIGVSTISEGGRWVYKLTGTTDSRGDAGVTVGAGIQW